MKIKYILLTILLTSCVDEYKPKANFNGTCTKDGICTFDASLSEEFKGNPIISYKYVIDEDTENSVTVIPSASQNISDDNEVENQNTVEKTIYNTNLFGSNKNVHSVKLVVESKHHQYSYITKDIEESDNDSLTAYLNFGTMEIVNVSDMDYRVSVPDSDHLDCSIGTDKYFNCGNYEAGPASLSQQTVKAHHKLTVNLAVLQQNISMLMHFTRSDGYQISAALVADSLNGINWDNHYAGETKYNTLVVGMYRELFRANYYLGTSKESIIDGIIDPSNMAFLLELK